MRVIPGLLVICALSAGFALDSKEYEEPTVLITLLVRNKAHTLPYFFSYIEKLEYPKQRIAFWIRCDHSSDDSIEVIQSWLRKSAILYHSVNYDFDNTLQSYQNETSQYDWPVSRFKHLIALKEEAMEYGRDIWADYVFFLDADVLLTSPQALTALTRLQLPIVAPMLLSEGLYSNFWCGMTEEYYYKRTDEYKEIYHMRKIGVYEVPVVHTAVLVNLNYAAARNLTFDRERLVEMQKQLQSEPTYSGPVDDIIVFAMSANSSGLPLRVSNELAFGYLMQPLEPTDSLDHDLQQLTNIRANMVNDLGQVPPVLDYFKHLIELPEKSKLSFDHIFMINLLRRPERREKMDRLFYEIGLDVEHFPAVDGKELDAQRVQEMGITFLPGYEDPYHHRPMTMGEIGCFLSHYRIWEQTVQRQLQQVLILEDDIRFEPYFKSNALRIMEQVEKHDFDLIYFGRKRLKDENEPWVSGTENLVHAGYSYWTLAYVITLQGAQKLLAAKPLENLIPVDEFLPVMFDRHPQKDWSSVFEPRNLIAFSAAPLLLYPTHYTGETGYISDTEDSQQVAFAETTADDPQPKSDRQQVFAKGVTNTLELDQDPKLGAIQLHSKCFELFEEIANEHNGNVTETLELIMNMTFHLHSIPECSKSGWPKSGDHISDWFIKLLEKYPDNISEVVTTFIECLITNPIREWKIVDEKVAIGYAAKYDAALYAKCNKSCTEILKQTINALDAVGMQLRSLELMERILQLETHVEWSLFRHEVSTKPREVTLIAETILSLNDRTFSVRRKACQVLNNSLKQGSPITMRILQECLKFTQFGDAMGPTDRKLQLRQERPAQQQHAYSFEGHEELEPLIKTMPQIIYKLFFNSNNGLARCSGIALMERLILVNPLIMYDTSYERVFSYFAVDTLSSVRKSAMESVDTLLQTYPSCTILIDLYCRIWPCLLNDEDIGLQKLALLSFNRNVLLNIRSLEYNEPKDRLPWLILATLLAFQPRNYIQQRLTLLLQNENIVNPKLVNTIIPYLHSVTATEAWVLLVFLSSRITNNLDSLITIFNDLSSHNLKCNQLLALELITYCPRNFSKAALNQLFKRLYEALKSGSIWLALVSPAVHLLNVIDRLSNSNGPQNICEDDWNLQLFGDVQSSILQCMDNFQDEHIRMASLLGTYTEILAKSSDQRANTQIVKFVLNYLQLYTKLNESNFDTDNERNLNWMVVIAGRFAIRDQNLAIQLSKTYGKILSRNDRPQLINSTLIAMNDLGKKYPIILENNMNFILIKLYSKFSTTRVRTYRCVKDVILAGNIKLKGPILISLLAGLVDDSPEVAREADAFFIRYKKLYDKMLFHHCLKECPFDFNDQAFLKGSTRLDASFKSPLKGEGMAKNRRLIYNHFIASLDETALLLYFGQLKLLAEKTKDKEFIRSPGALAVVVDILFIMRRICSCTKAKGQQGGTQTDGDAGDGEEPSAAAQQDQLAVAETTAPTRGRAKKGDPCEEPLKQLERCLRYVPDTFRNLSSVMNPELQHEFELFCNALTVRFSNYTDYAQPAEFWEKYKLNRTNKTKTKPKTKRSRRKEADSVLANETEDSIPFSSADKDSDSEMPLDRHTLANTTQGEQKRTGGFDVLATELIFQQHDW